MGTKKRAPAVRVEARILILDETGRPARTLETCFIDYMSVRLGMLCYQYIRNRFRLQRKEGKDSLFDSRETLESGLQTQKYRKKPSECGKITETNQPCWREIPCPVHGDGM